MTKISIVGSGLSGLSASILLAYEGYEVSIYEKERQIGGDFQTIQMKHHHFEFGPTFFVLPEVLESVFRVVNREPSDYIDIIELPKHTKVYFQDGTEFYLTKDRQLMKEQLQKIDPFAAENYDEFMEEIQRIYYETTTLSNELQITNWTKLIATPIRNLLLKLKPFESLTDFLAKYFKNENLIELFSRYANQGMAPLKTLPAFMSAFLYPTLSYSVFTVKGGNMKIPKALKKLAVELGVKFYTEKEVTKVHVKNNQVEGIQINHTMSLESDYVLLSTSKLMDEKNIIDSQYLQKEKSKWFVRKSLKLSQFIVFVSLNKHFGLEQHSVLFSNNVEEEIEQLTNGQFAASPTLYVYNPSYLEPDKYPFGDSLIVIAAVPFVDNNSISSRADIASYRHAVFEKLKQHGIDISDSIEEDKIWTPIDMRNALSQFDGEIYGGISQIFADAYILPPIKSAEIEGLYFTFVNTQHPMGSSDAVKNGIHLASRIIDDAKMK